jgi:Ca-activated chloride channel homolog
MESVFIVVLAIAVVVGAMYVLSNREPQQKKGRTATSSRATRKRRSYARRPAGWTRWVPILLLVAAVASLVVALAQFRITQTATQGTVVLTMDTSQSMNQTDVAPSRLEAAKAAAREFLDELPPEFPVGLVTFAGEATVISPPVEDRARVSQALDEVPRGRGTVIGDGLAAALTSIEGDWASNGRRPTAVVLLSDGRDTGSETPPDAAAQRAAALDVRVFTVVLGEVTPGEKGGANAELLQQLAATTGGQTYTAETASELSQLYTNLGTQLSTELAISSSAALFVAVAVALAVAAGLVVLVTNRPEF